MNTPHPSPTRPTAAEQSRRIRERLAAMKVTVESRRSYPSQPEQIRQISTNGVANRMPASRGGSPNRERQRRHRKMMRREEDASRAQQEEEMRRDPIEMRAREEMGRNRIIVGNGREHRGRLEEMYESNREHRIQVEENRKRSEEKMRLLVVRMDRLRTAVQPTTNTGTGTSTIEQRLDDLTLDES